MRNLYDPTFQGRATACTFRAAMTPKGDKKMEAMEFIPEPPRPFLPPPQQRLEYLSSDSGLRPMMTAPVAPTSSLHFLVHPAMVEVQDYAAQRGWFAQGFTTLSIEWLELHWTSDGWKTTHVLSSTDVPCPVVNGFFFLPNVPRGMEVEFALRVGVACHAPHDTAGSRETGELWLNNAGANFKQSTR